MMILLTFREVPPRMRSPYRQPRNSSNGNRNNKHTRNGNGNYCHSNRKGTNGSSTHNNVCRSNNGNLTETAASMAPVDEDVCNDTFEDWLQFKEFEEEEEFAKFRRLKRQQEQRELGETFY